MSEEPSPITMLQLQIKELKYQLYEKDEEIKELRESYQNAEEMFKESSFKKQDIITELKTKVRAQDALIKNLKEALRATEKYTDQKLPQVNKQDEILIRLKYLEEQTDIILEHLQALTTQIAQK